jgi:hypothetical protein
MSCPNKNLLEYKALEKSVGELEAFRVFDTYKNDIPLIFADPSLSKLEITALANIYSQRQSPNDLNQITNKVNTLLAKTDVKTTKGIELTGLKLLIDSNTPIKKEKTSYESLESKLITTEKINILSKILKVNVVEDPNLNAYSQIDAYKEGETPTMRINFNHGGLRKDTIIHEFGHIFIDALGGMSNDSIKVGRRHLKGSNIEAEVMNDPQYAGLDQNTLDKEILATAIGREGSDIYDSQNNILDRFQNWLKVFYNNLRKTLSLDYDSAFLLANKLLNNEITLGDVMGEGSEVAQKQVFKGTLTPVQETTLQAVLTHSNQVSLSSNDKHYMVAHIEGLLQRTSNRMDIVYPNSAFPEERRKYYEAARQWGNMNDLIWNEVANGKTYAQVTEALAEAKSLNSEMAKFNLSEEVVKEIFTYADEWVKSKVSQNYVVLSQQAIYSEGTMVAGTTDIIAIAPNGNITIMDNKSSSNPTAIGSSYGNINVATGRGEWTYYDRGKLESYYNKHTKQQSAYAKMYEDLGFTVDHIYIQPVHWSGISENRQDINEATIEDIIELAYNEKYASSIIDNSQVRGRTLFSSDEIVEDALNKMTERVNERVQVVMAKYERSLGKQKWYAEMVLLANQLELGSNLSNLNEFISQGISRVAFIKAQFAKIKKNPKYNNDVIYSYSQFAETFNIVDQILEFTAQMEVELDGRDSPAEVKAAQLEELKVKMTTEERADLKVLHKEQLNKAKQDRFTSIYIKRSKKNLIKLSTEVKQVKNTYVGIAKERMALKLGAVSKWGEQEFRKNALLKWKLENKRKEKYPSMSRTAWLNLAEEKVNELVAKNKTLIATMNYNRMKDILSEAPSDLNTLSMWVEDAKNLDDSVIQVTERLLAKAEYTAMRSFIESVQETESIYQDFVTAKGVSETDYDVLYEDLYESVDGRATNNLVGKYSSSYKVAENAWYDANKKKGYNPTFTERQLFYEELRANHINPQWEKLMAMEESNPIRKMYEHIHATFDKIDSLLPPTHSLGIYYSDAYDAEKRTNIMHKQYKLPSIEKTTIARLKQQGVLKTLGAGAADMLKRDTETTESGEQALDEEGKVATKTFNLKDSVKKILLDERNREAKFVPIHYRGTVTKGQQSLDLMSITLIDYNMALSYESKAHIAPELEMIRDVLEKRRVVQTDSSSNPIINLVGSGLSWAQTNEEFASNSYKAFVSLMDDRLYGISSIDLGEIKLPGIGNINVNKFNSLMMGWTGDTFLMINYLAAGTGFLQGNVMNWMEAVAGTDISKTSLAKAEAMYLGVGHPRIAAGIVRDIGARRPTGLVGLLNERFNARSDFSGLHARYGTNTAINMASKDSLHSLQDMQEHFVQGTLMMGILLDYNITDNDGKNEIPLMEAYEVTEEGFLKIKDGYENAVTQDLEFEMSTKIREVGKQAHGNYDSNNKAMIQRYAAGKLVFMLRKWLVTGVQKRYRGLISHALAPGLEDVQKKPKFFSESLGRFEEGMYTTAILFLRNLHKESKFLSMRLVSQELDNLSSDERANLKRVVFELGATLGALLAQGVLAGLAKGEKDPEKKKKLYLAALYLRRLYAELSFYWHLGEALTILRSPMATMSIIEKIYELIGQGTSDLWNLEFEKYKRGPRKDEAKIKKRLYGVMPVMSQVDREVEEMYKLLSRDD